MELASGAVLPVCEAPLRVGEWVVHTDLLRLECRERQVVIEPRPMQVLQYLAARPEQVISTDELLAEVWGAAFLGDEPVQRAMTRLRQALGDDPRNPRYVRTVRKRGYCLVAAVSTSRSSDMGVAQLRPRWSGRPPYPGLSAYSRNDAGAFFGRAQLTANVVRALHAQCSGLHAFVLVVGASGAGKTSLIQAGVIPLLDRPGGFGGLHARAIAHVDFADVESYGTLCALSDALRGLRIEGGAPFAGLTQESLGGADGAEILSQALAAVTRASDSRILVILDHAERLAISGRQTHVMLLPLLGVLVTSPATMVVMLTRADLYPDLLAALPPIAEWKQPQGHIDVTAPSAAELGDIVRQPAAAAGVRFGRDPTRAIGVDALLIEQSEGQTHSLPLLQYVLSALYERRTPDNVLTAETFHALGGLHGAIAAQVAGALDGMPTADLEEGLDTLLGCLVATSADGKRPVARMAPWHDLSTPSARELASRLIDARVLIADLVSGVPHIRLAHEALLSVWPAAAGWISQNEDHLQARERLRMASRRWVDAERPPDLLLPAGTALDEAVRISEVRRNLLSSEERAYLAASRAHQRRHSRKQCALWAGLATSGVAALVAAIAAREAVSDAMRQRTSSAQLADVLVDYLPDRLRPLGRLDLLSDVSRAVLSTSDAADCGGDSRHALLQAKAHRTQAEVQYGQGQASAADASLLAAQSCWEIAAARDSSSTEVILEGGTLAFWRGMLAYGERRYREAEPHLRAYEVAARRLVEIEPGNPAWWVEHSYALNNLGTLALVKLDYESAGQAFSQSIELKRRVLALRPDDQVSMAELADSHSWFATTLDRSGHLEEAVLEVFEQIALLKTLVERDPTATLWRFRLGLAYSIAGDTSFAAGLHADVDRLDALAAESMAIATSTDPQNAVWALAEAHAHVMRARHMLAFNDVDSALAELDHAQLKGERIGADMRGSSGRMTAALASALRADALLRRGDAVTAIGLADEASATLRQLLDALDGDVEILSNWLYAELVRGTVLFRLGHTEAARTAWRDALRRPPAFDRVGLDRRVSVPRSAIAAALASAKS